MEPLKKEILDDLISKLDLSVSLRSKSLISEGKPLRSEKEFKSKLRDILMTDSQSHLGRFSWAGGVEGVQDRMTYLYGEVKKWVQCQIDTRNAPQVQVDNTLLAEYSDLEHLYPINEVGGERFMFNHRTMTVSPITFETWSNLVSKEVRSAKLALKYLGRKIFDPHKDTLTQSSVDDGTISVLDVNSYIRPDWTRLKPNAEGLEVFWKYFNHLFTTESSRKYVLSWCKNMLNSRSATFLYLTGRQGVGKTLFANICCRLVGDSNFVLGQRNFASTDFNGFIENKQLVFIDEFNCKTLDEKETLKRIINNKVALEKKGLDQITTKNHSSFILANNNPDGVTVMPEDRRFSIPEMTDKRLESIFSQEDIQNFVRMIDGNDQFICNVASEMQKAENMYNETPYQESAFWKVVRDSSRDGYRFIIDQIEKKEHSHILYRDLRSKFKTESGSNRSTFPHSNSVRDYFSAFKINGKRIADCDGYGAMMRITPINDYAVEGDILTREVD